VVIPFSNGIVFAANPSVESTPQQLQTSDCRIRKFIPHHNTGLGPITSKVTFSAIRGVATIVPSPTGRSHALSYVQLSAIGALLRSLRD
jgi:hypothetical protein